MEPTAPPPHRFTAVLAIVGVNPFVFVPPEILAALFLRAGKDRGSIPIRGRVGAVPYRQTLVKFQGEWRLYINLTMLKKSPQRIGETLDVVVEYDPESREITPPQAFLAALEANPDAGAVFEGLSPSRRHEIVRYLARLKSPDVLEANVGRALNFLRGNERFVGRDKP